jgi:hypothetical protein
MALTKATPSVISIFESNGNATMPRVVYYTNIDGDSNNTMRILGYVDDFYFIAASNSGAASGTRLLFTTAPAGGGQPAPAMILDSNGRLISKSYSETRTAPTISSGTLTLNLNNGNVFDVSLNANITTLTIQNPPTTGTSFSFILQLTADGTPRSVNWGSAVKWPSGTAPTLTSTSGKVDTFVFLTDDGGTTYFAFTAGQNA